PANETNRERLLLWRAGVAMALDHPLVGVGQNQFPALYPAYRSPDVREPSISHLHNNVLEITVERGVLGLAAWLSLWVVAGAAMIRAWRLAVTPADRTALAAGIGGMTAFLAAGMFEYNFGDTEIQMLVYLLLAAGMAAARQEKSVVEGDNGGRPSPATDITGDDAGGAS
ncbi:MAG: O-antigen ligase family protein, partial [Nitrospinae bacterium]|nr:O-antigen ligase family protein [Nitrospinota bacterium]